MESEKNTAKVVLVTGASSGIGEATAQQLKEEGFIVIAAARRIERMVDLEQKGIKIIKMDVTDEESMVSGIQQIINQFGRIDVLVNNAGYGSFGALEDVPISEARNQFEVNVFGLARLTQLVLPYMRKNSWGRIINISSIGGKIYEPFGSWYHATKFAVEGLSDSLRLELRPFGIDVVIIEPGAIRTEWGQIAGDNLAAVARGTAYESISRGMVSQLRMSSSSPTFASPPSVIADTICKAATAKRPKTRYVAGKMAGTVLFMRKILSDRALDSIFASMMLKEEK